MSTTGVDLAEPIHKAYHIVMYSAFPLPFKVDNQAIWEKHILNFYTMYPRVVAIYHPFI